MSGAGMATLYSLIESPFHPDLGALYRKLGIEEEPHIGKLLHFPFMRC